ncbi:uncharacterized protein [Montipora capricornis]|uniref:uncharacterized protein n=1 Tax=Montipora capricornis TaxID=246305 RepID=UPI0035F1AF0B
MSEGEIDPVAHPVSGKKIADQMTEDAERVNGENCTQVFERLRKKMLPRGMREKLKVDPEDQVMDVYAYIKSADFDALGTISVFVKGQPAVDAGGVLKSLCRCATMKASNTYLQESHTEKCQCSAMSL